MKPSAPSKVSWDQQLVSMPYAPTPSPSLSSASPVILVFKHLSSFEARRFVSPESCLGDSDLCSHAEVLVCSRHGPASRPRGQPGPHMSLGCALSSEAGNTPATPGQSPRPSGWLRPPLLSSLGLRGHQRGSAAYGQEGGLACGVPSPPWSGEAVLFLKPSLSVCLAQNVSGAPG